jgi:hypothetical protein
MCLRNCSISCLSSSNQSKISLASPTRYAELLSTWQCQPLLPQTTPFLLTSSSSSNFSLKMPIAQTLRDLLLIWLLPALLHSPLCVSMQGRKLTTYSIACLFPSYSSLRRLLELTSRTSAIKIFRITWVAYCKSYWSKSATS